jgi:hypothetical protein
MEVLVKLAMASASVVIGRRGMLDFRLVSCITLYNVRYAWSRDAQRLHLFEDVDLKGLAGDCLD